MEEPNRINSSDKMDAEWTATALFSPSKARAQQAQAKDWAAVDAWVAKKYGSRLPPFERNQDTLEALLALARLNENADEERNQIERIEKMAYQSLTRIPQGINEEILHVLEAELANEEHLDTLAEVAVALDCPNVETSTMAREIIKLSTSEFEAEQQVQEAESQLTALKSECARVKKLVAELKSDDFQAPPDIIENTSEWTRSTKNLKTKLAEYDERLSATRPASKSGDMDSVQRKHKDVAAQRAQLADLEADLQAFQDLPPDLRSARRKLEQARAELRELTAHRDNLLEDLAR
jgi:HAUS augmin-like complex subunit 1